MYEKIKISAPRKNPHICYIPKDRKEAVKAIKITLGKSLYKILCEVSGVELDTEESIRKFKTKVKKKGFKNIGEWATALIDFLNANIQDLSNIDLSSIELSKGE